MFAVMFEVWPKPDAFDDYLRYAGMLRPALEAIDGFLDNRRFASRRRPGWLLSLSLWRDEKAVIRWRTAALHHEVQSQGRDHVFADYHLRVGEIVADDGLAPGERPAGQRFDETESGAAKQLLLTERTLDAPLDDASLAAALDAPGPHAPGLVAWDMFEDIKQPGAFALLTAWRDEAAAARAQPPARDGARHRRIRVIRDYGMFARAEAPQYHKPVPHPRSEP